MNNYIKDLEIDIIEMVQNEILQGYFEEREFEDKIYEFVHEFIDNHFNLLQRPNRSNSRITFIRFFGNG